MPYQAPTVAPRPPTYTTVTYASTSTEGSPKSESADQFWFGMSVHWRIGCSSCKPNQPNQGMWGERSLPLEHTHQKMPSCTSRCPD